MWEKEQRDHPHLDDRLLARDFGAGDAEAVRTVTMNNNQRLFRVAWSILRSRAEAEDVVQNVYLRAYTEIASYQGRSSLSTWLTRIAINEALERRRRALRQRERLNAESVVILQEYREKLMKGSSSQMEPESELARRQIRLLLEKAIGRLPAKFRTVFILREIEQLSVENVADLLGIPEATVKTRCLRARSRIRKELAPELRQTLEGTFPFAGADCEALTARVLKQLQEQGEQG